MDLKITFRDIKNAIPFAICQARYIRFFLPNPSERSEIKESFATSNRQRPFCKNSRRFPLGQYSIIIQSSELLPKAENIHNITTRVLIHYNVKMVCRVCATCNFLVGNLLTASPELYFSFSQIIL